MSMSDCLHIITKYGRRFVYSSRHFILCVSILISAALIQSHIHLLTYVTHIISSLSLFYQLSLNTMYIIKDRQKAIIH